MTTSETKNDIPQPVVQASTSNKEPHDQKNEKEQPSKDQSANVQKEEEPEAKPAKEKPKRGKSFKWSNVEKFIQNKAKEIGIQYKNPQRSKSHKMVPQNTPADVKSGEHKTKEPTIDVCDLDKETIIQIEAPGTSKENCNINIDGNLLVFRGVVKRSDFMDPSKTRINQRYYGEYKRTFNLPKNANIKSITAKHENGVLTIRIPIETEAKETSGSLQIE